VSGITVYEVYFQSVSQREEIYVMEGLIEASKFDKKQNIKRSQIHIWEPNYVKIDCNEVIT